MGISYGSDILFSLPCGGGGNPDLVSGGAPTNGTQAKPSGTTSSDAITFQAPTGGSGSSTPSVALAHVVGSGASLSGSGLGPYTVNSLEDGDVVTVTCTHTDDGDGQVVTDEAVVAVAAAGGGAAYPDTLLDWSASSETFSAGEDTYTIGGLSATLSYVGTSGPDAIDLSSGLLSFTMSGANSASLIIDLGVDITDETVMAVIAIASIVANTTSGILFKLSSGTNTGNAANQWQASIGHAGNETQIRFREANSTTGFTNVETPTVTDITTTPTRIGLVWHGASGSFSWDQGDATLPTDGANLTNTGSSVINDAGGSVGPQDRRYLHLLIKSSCTFRVGAVLRRVTP
jgi:hypothetical protein